MEEYWKAYIGIITFLLMMGVFCFTKGALYGFLSISLPLMGMMFIILMESMFFNSNNKGYAIVVCFLLGLGNVMQVLVGNKTAENFISLEWITFFFAMVLCLIFILFQAVGNRIMAILSSACGLIV